MGEQEWAPFQDAARTASSSFEANRCSKGTRQECDDEQRDQCERNMMMEEVVSRRGVVKESSGMKCRLLNFCDWARVHQS